MFKLYNILLFLLLHSIIAFANSDNLIKNGDFEQKGFTVASKNWKDNSAWAEVDVTYKRIFDKDRDGFVQHIRCESFKHGAVQFVQSGVPIQTGETYRVSLWAKGDINVPLEILFRKHGNPYTTYFSKAFKISDEWKKYSFVAPVNVTDSSTYFMFRFTSKGDIYLDDISVIPVDDLSIDSHQNDGNLIGNGSFEIGTYRWGVEYRGIGHENEMAVRALDLAATMDSSRSKYGKHSLKIPSVDTAKFLLNSEYIVLNPNKKHTLSFWAYSERQRNIYAGIVSGYFGNNRKQLETIHVGPEWKYYVISAESEITEDNLYFVSFEGWGADSLWIDGVQLVEGDAKPFLNKTPVEIGFSKKNNHSLFDLNEKISIKVHISGNKQPGVCKVKVDSFNYYDEKKTLLYEDCNLDSYSLDSFFNKDIILSPPSDKTGYFRLVAEVLLNGKSVDSSEHAIGVVPKIIKNTVTDDLNSPFGGHGRFVKSELDTLSQLGVRWLRMHPPHGTKWSQVEINKGKFNYSDKEILPVKEAGFNILGSLDKTPRWASDAPDNYKRYWSYPPRDLDDWENYVFNVVSHYKGIIDYWEVWNEPDSDGFLKIPGVFGRDRKPDVYVELLRRAYIAAKKANPDAVIVGGSATGKPPSRWLKKIFDKGALDYMDIVSFHYYTDGRPGDALGFTIAAEVRKINDLIKQNTKRNIPIWETESGVMYPKSSYTTLKEVSPSYAVPDDEAAAYMVRNYVHLLASGVKKWFYYSMYTSPRTDRREATGFFEWDGSPRPLSIAYAVLSSMLSNLLYADTYDINESLVITMFSNDKKDLLVVSTKLWKKDALLTHSMRTSDLYKSYKLFNIMGNEIDFNLDNSTLEFDVGREPVYLVAYKK